MPFVTHFGFNQINYDSAFKSMEYYNSTKYFNFTAYVNEEIAPLLCISDYRWIQIQLQGVRRVKQQWEFLIRLV